MKFGYETLKERRILLIVAAFILFASAAGAVYSVLRTVSPRETETNTSPERNPKDELAKKAKEAAEAGRAAMTDNDPETAAQKLAEAKELYIKAGDAEMAEEIDGQLFMAEHEVTVNEENPEADAPASSVR